MPGELVGLPRRDGDVDLAGRAERGIDAVAVEVGEQRVVVLVSEAHERVDLVREVRQAIGDAMGDGGREEPTVSARGTDPGLARLEHEDVASGVVRVGLQRGPQPGVAGADDDEIGVGGSGERRGRIGPTGLVQPEDGGFGIRQCGVGPGP